ncbi:GGDEF domain-containing protein [Aquifex sp.]
MREEIKVKLLLNIFEEVTRKYEELLKLYEEMNELLEYKASHDSLTGLYNREALYNILKAEVMKAKLSRKVLSVIFLDLDNFKALNDTYGHQYGDEVLKKVGEILKSSVRKGDIVARYGGDEFVIVLHSKTNLEPEKVAERIKVRIEESLRMYNISVSYGIAIFGEDGSTPEELINAADKKMYEQKQKKKNLKNQVVF